MSDDDDASEASTLGAVAKSDDDGAPRARSREQDNTVPKEGLEPSHPKAQEPKSCVSTSSTTPALLDCLARQARSTRIALGTRLLRRRSQSKSVFAQSSSTRRSARSGFTSPGFACAAIESTDASCALTWNRRPARRCFSAHSHECSSKGPLEPSLVALCGVTGELAR